VSRKSAAPVPGTLVRSTGVFALAVQCTKFLVSAVALHTTFLPQNFQLVVVMETIPPPAHERQRSSHPPDKSYQLKFWWVGSFAQPKTSNPKLTPWFVSDPKRELILRNSQLIFAGRHHTVCRLQRRHPSLPHVLSFRPYDALRPQLLVAVALTSTSEPCRMFGGLQQMER
jgi:hypothetical protein